MGLCAAAFAGEPPANPLRIAGTVKYEDTRQCLPPLMSWPELKDATLSTPSGETYRLVMDGKGAELALVMNLEPVEVFGEVTTNAGQAWLRVIGYVDPRMEEAHELWRRMCCSDCAVSAALVNASLPRSLRGARAIAGQCYPQRPKVACWTRDADGLWVATGNEVARMALGSKRLVRTYGRADGLPDGAIYQLYSDGALLWIVHRGGVSTLDPAGGRVSENAALRANFARVTGNETSVWVIADTGTFRFAPGRPAAILERGPPLPTSARIRKRVEDGIWSPHWSRETGDFIPGAALAGGQVQVQSLGDVYAFDGRWRRISEQGWELQERAGRVWFVGLRGLTEVDPATGKQQVHTPPRISDGRYSHFLLDRDAAWLASEPAALRAEEDAGGLARLDLSSGQWRVWTAINGQRVNHVEALCEQDGALWAVAAAGAWRTESADPGMLHVQRNAFVPDRFILHRFDGKTQEWTTVPLSLPEVAKRLVCGHAGSGEPAGLLTQSIRDLCVSPARVFASVRLCPAGYFGGYWPSVAQLASRPAAGAAWATGFAHHPEDIGLQGEQPDVLNISNSGRRMLPAMGHDNVLGLFVNDGTAWAVTEGGVACFDEPAGRWRRLYETAFRFYWRATAALDDGEALYVGSDRGLVSRLDIATGRWEMLAALKDRSVTRIVQPGRGALRVTSKPAPLGRLPVQLHEVPNVQECEAAEFDGKTWRAVDAMNVATNTQDPPRWFFKAVEKRHARDKSQGNFLWGYRDGEREAEPMYYVKEAFYPQFLGASPDGSRLWLSTFDGIVRLDVAGAVP